MGCTKKSLGCRNCYAERLEARFGRDFSTVRRASPKTFAAPLKWKKPRMIFTCSMSDFFHEAADDWRKEAWDVIRRTPRHVYQILTKRPERIRDALPKDWGDGWPNVWLGTSIETESYIGRMATLGKVPAKIRFISAEPLLGPIDFSAFRQGIWFRTVHWMITGGESGPRARPAKLDWFRQIRDQCEEAGIPFFLKQLGGSRKCGCHGSWGCRTLDGEVHDEFPV